MNICECKKCGSAVNGDFYDYCEDCIDDMNSSSGASCGYCGAEDGEECSLKCPNNTSPFAELLRNGYD